MGEPGGPSTASDSSSSGGAGESSPSGNTSSSCGHPQSLRDLDPSIVAGMTADELKQFIDTGRTGRRNALPDVTQPDIAATSTAGVAEALESLSVKNTDDTGQSSGTGS